MTVDRATFFDHSGTGFFIRVQQRFFSLKEEELALQGRVGRTDTWRFSP